MIKCNMYKFLYEYRLTSAVDVYIFLFTIVLYCIVLYSIVRLWFVNLSLNL